MTHVSHRLLIQYPVRIAVFLTVLALMMCSLAGSEKESALVGLDHGFTHPPREAKPSVYWLWLNGYANREFMDQELKAFADHGIGGLCIFDMGARGDAKFFPPTGPAFMSPESVEALAAAIRAARRHGLDVQLAACSSWDLGGSWVRPELASMALFRTEMRVGGPKQIDVKFPFPELSPNVPRQADGRPAFYKDVAILAVPETKRLPGHEFVFRLPRGDIHDISHIILYNAKAEHPERHGDTQFYAKEFSVAVSVESTKRSDFRDIVRGSLEPHTEPQRFEIPTTGARYVRLRVVNGHHPNIDRVQLAEFEVYSTAGENVAASKVINRTRDSAEIVWFSSEASAGGNWTVGNLHDGAKSRPDGMWSFSGPPPLLIEDRNQIVDLSDRLDADQRLRWQVPPGRWTLMRFVCANTGERLKVPSPRSDGLATDHFNSKATREFIQTIVDRLQDRLGDLNAAGIKQIYLPSYEVVGAKWTPDFLDQFQQYRHYDMTRYLPVLGGCLVESEEQTQRFLYDFEKTLGDLLVDAYYRTASETARRAGLGIEAEAGGPGPPVHQVPVDALKALGSIDEMRGEFWPWRPDRNGLWVVKETACAAHIYGHRRVHMEAFTGFHHWTDGPTFLKSSADRAFCEGMNHVVWHTSSHQPPEAGKPGWVYGAGTHLTPNLVWWPMAKPFIDYLSRCSYMLQQGLFVGDVCYYYGDQGSNFVPPKRIDPSLGYGYDYDVTNPEVILQRMTARNGRLVLPDGMQYELLVLPDRSDIDLAVLKKIGDLVRAGATVVGPKPTTSNGLTDYPRRDADVKRLADKLWGDCDGKSVTRRQCGKGQIIWGRPLREILKDRGVGPDFQFVSDDNTSQLDFIHRRTADADIYFVRNATQQTDRVLATFRVRGKTPEFWDPITGSIQRCLVYEQTTNGVRVPLSLAPLGSLFVVFRSTDRPAHFNSASEGLSFDPQTDARVRVTAGKNGSYQMTSSGGQTTNLEFDQLPPTLTLSQPWRVRFAPGLGAPESILMRDLTDWTDHPHIGIKYYSGIARYHTSFSLPESWLASNRGVQLDLGRLWAVGRVHVNERDLGVLWKPPYRMDITEALRAGTNRLVIEIANTWSNRLVGDTQLPEEKRYCRTNITRSGTPSKPWSQVALRKSGLFGPVTLIPTISQTITMPASKN